MAGNWVAIGSYRSVQVLSTTVVIDVEVVTFQTSPSGIVCTYAVPYESWKSDAGAALVGNVATQLEQLVANHHVVGGSPSQDVDPSNLLVDYEDLTVAYDRTSTGLPPLYGTVSVPLSAFELAETGIGGLVIPGTQTPADYVDAEYNRLAALAAG